MWTRDTFVSWDNMPNFCALHLTCLAILLTLCLVVPWAAKQFLAPKNQQRLGQGLAWVASSGYLLWLLATVAMGAFDPVRDLPLEFCYLVGLAAPLATARKSQVLFDFFYYCGLSGVLHACITPIFAPAYPHPRFFAFWALHGGVVLTIVYAVVILGRKPTYRGIFTTFAILIGMLSLLIPVNAWVDANYFYLRQKPIGSVQELMGPWPWYVLGTVLIGLLNFHLSYVPIACINRRVTTS